MRPKRDVLSRKQVSAIVLALLLFSTCAVPEAESKSNGILQVSVDSMPQSHMKTVQGQITVDAPPHTVWQVLTDYPGWVNRVPGYEQSRILKSTASGKVLDVTMKVNTLLPSCRYQVQTQERETLYQLTFQRISGDFDEMVAVYRLSPQNHGRQTVMSYVLNIDIGMPMPGISGILKSNAEKSLAALKRYSELEASRSAIGQR